jgi:hypothetical protein
MHRFAKFLIVLLAIALVAPAGLGGDADVLAKKKGKLKTKTFTNMELVSIWAGGAGAPRSTRRTSGSAASGRARSRTSTCIWTTSRTADQMTSTSCWWRQTAAAPDHPPGNGQIVAGAFAPVNYSGVDPFVGAPPVSGDVALSTFNGIKANGVWRLYIFDDTDDEGGSLPEGWSLTITAKVKKKT